jgi:hypothetical protein
MPESGNVWVAFIVWTMGEPSPKSHDTDDRLPWLVFVNEKVFLSVQVFE